MELNEKLTLVPGPNARNFFPGDSYEITVTENEPGLFAVTFPDGGRLSFDKAARKCSVTNPRTTEPLDIRLIRDGIVIWP